MQSKNTKIIGLIAILGVVIAVIIAGRTTSPAGVNGQQGENSGTSVVSMQNGSGARKVSQKLASHVRTLRAGSTESQDLLDHLKKELVSGDEDRIAEAITQAPALDDAELVVFVREGLKSVKMPEYRSDLVVMLQSLPGRESIVTLNSALEDESPAVREAAISAIASSERMMEDLYSQANKQLESGKGVPDDLELPEQLTDADLTSVADGIVKLANDKEEDVRNALGNAFDLVGGDFKTVALQAASSSEYVDVRKAALTSLTGDFEKSRAGLLMSFLDDGDEELRNEAQQFCLHFMGENFETAKEAIAWWKANSDRFNDDMSEKDAE